MNLTSKDNSELVSSWIEHESQERTREFRKYWEHKSTPQNEIEDLIQSNPNRVVEIIFEIAEKIEGKEKLETKLICGLIYDFEHYHKDKYAELLEKLKDLSIHQYLTANQA